jgi:hypothetical protein
MTRRMRLALKLAAAAFLIAVLLVFGETSVDFVYTNF